MWNTCVPLVFLVTGVATQCVARGQTFNAPLHDPSTVTEEIRPLQLLEDLFTFFRLMRNEFYYSVSENITMTTPAQDVLSQDVLSSAGGYPWT